jgi:flagellar basal body-associated protein FliL
MFSLFKKGEKKKMKKEIVVIVVLIIIVIAATTVIISQNEKYNELAEKHNKAVKAIADLKNPTEIKALKVEVQGKNATIIKKLTLGLMDNSQFVLVNITTTDGKVTEFGKGGVIKLIN